MIDWGRISRITNFCISRLTTEAVINAKAEAIKESTKHWFDIFEERNLADPECHYEATLCKYAGLYHNAALDNVAREHERLIRETPAIIFGKLSFIDQVKVAKGPMVESYHPRVQIWMEHDGTAKVGILCEDNDYVNIYTMEVEIW